MRTMFEVHFTLWLCNCCFKLYCIILSLKTKNKKKQKKQNKKKNKTKKKKQNQKQKKKQNKTKQKKSILVLQKCRYSSLKCQHRSIWLCWCFLGLVLNRRNRVIDPARLYRHFEKHRYKSRCFWEPMLALFTNVGTAQKSYTSVLKINK